MKYKINKNINKLQRRRSNEGKATEKGAGSITKCNVYINVNNYRKKKA